MYNSRCWQPGRSSPRKALILIDKFPNLLTITPMETGHEKIASGLEGVVVAETRLSEVDGERGRLILAGHDVEEIAGKLSFEEVCLLFWTGKLPDQTQTDQLKAQLGQARLQAFRRIERLGDALLASDGMDALRASVGHLKPEGSANDPIQLT